MPKIFLKKSLVKSCILTKLWLTLRYEIKTILKKFNFEFNFKNYGTIIVLQDIKRSLTI